MNSPGAVYKAGEYRGKDIIPITTSWRNDSAGEPGRQSRPIGLIGDGYSMSLRLSTDAEFAESATAANDDFSFYSYALGGDLGGLIADGTTDYRQVIVTGTPGAVPPYGITGIPGTERVYFPQPDDGFLDIGERVDWVVQTLIPENYASEGYFVTSRVRMDPARDADAGNNTFVSNAADKIAILETASPSIEPMSAVTTETGGYVQGGNAASDSGAVSEDGSAVVFISRATNLLAPASGSGTTVPTTGQQVFLKQPSTGEVDLISGPGVGLVSANADCFNPTISANGRYIAYDSAASNILPSVFTAAKSMIYVFDRTTGETVIVSRNSDGALADGSSFNPKLSESGRFVVFESTASNLDLPKVTPVITAGAITSYTIDRPGSGYPLAPASPPAVSITSSTGSGATAAALVGPALVPPMVIGGISQITPGSGGSGYGINSTTVSVASPPAGPTQVYLHDRDTDADGIFDEGGNTATYLVSGNVRPVPGGGAVVERSDNVSYAPVINLDDSASGLIANGGIMYVAFASYASNLPDPNPFGSMVYRAAVRVTGDVNLRGLSAVEAVSVNNDGDIPTLTTAEYAAGFKPDSYQPSINGDGTQIAFTSWGSNLVYNPTTNLFDADTNGVQDVFVRDFSTVPVSTVRVSVSEERVATGIVAFLGAVGPDNIPVSQPAPGDTVAIGDGVDQTTFVFDPVTQPGPGQVAVPIGATVQETRDNLIDAINGAGLRIQAFVTTPPNEDPGTSYVAAIYLRNTVPGEAGNVPISVASANLVLAAVGMSGGGSQATDAPVAVQGVPFGSSEPSIDRSGRFVAFRTIAENLDVHTRTAVNNYDGSPITGELIRPLIFPTSNVYVRDRLADGEPGGVYDIPSNSKTTRVSVNKFGYPTSYGGTQSGVGSPLTANNATPTISANGRFVVFSSDAEGQGGLVFGPNNLTPLDNDRIRAVFLHDRRTLGDDPPPPSSRPTVEMTSPTDGLRVPPGSTVALSATATPAAGKQINNVQFFINGSPFGPALTAEPYSLTYTLPTAGRYSIRVVATDSKGITSSDALAIEARAPVGVSPSVAITQPSGVTRFVTGADLTLNVVASDTDGTIVPGSVRFFINGTPINATPTGIANTYTASYRPTAAGTVTLTAQATDNDGNTSVSVPVALSFVPAGLPLPAIEILELLPGTPRPAGGLIPLRAEVNAAGAAADDVIVQFVANGSVVGTAARQTDGTYLLIWNTPALPGSFTVYARILAPGASVSEGEGEEGDIFYYSALSSNFLTINTATGVPPSVVMQLPIDGTTATLNEPLTLRASAGGSPGVAEVNLSNGGSGYTSAPDVSFVGGGGTGAMAVAVLGTGADAGKVVRVDMTDVGSGYTSVPTVAFSGGGGSGAAATAVLRTATVASVQFYVNGQAIGTAITGQPYQTTYTPTSQGTYVFSAVAIGTDGLKSLPDSVVVAISSGAAPVVTISNPAESAKYPSGTTIPISATATPPLSNANARVVSMQFFVDGVSIPSSTDYPNPDTQAPFLSQFQVPGQGPFKLTAIATDNFGNVGASSVSIEGKDQTAGQETFINLTHPVVDYSYSTASDLYLNATVIAPTNLTVGTNDVTFFINGQAYRNGLTQVGNTFGVYWRPSSEDFFTVSAQVKTTNNGINIVSPPQRFTIDELAQSLPSIQMLPLANTNIRLGSTTYLQAKANGGLSDVDRVDFYADQIFLGSVSLGAAADNEDVLALFPWKPANASGPTGFKITARAIQFGGSAPDNSVISTNSFPLVVEGPASGLEPVVTLAQTPIAERNYVIGSELFLNATAVAQGSATINTNSVQFFYRGQTLTRTNGVASSGVFAGTNVIYTARVPVQSTALANFVFASAKDSSNNLGNSDPGQINSAAPLKALPAVQMLPKLPGQPEVAGGFVTLRAQATFPGSAGQNQRVEFYANGAFVGVGTNSTTQSNTYSFQWQTPTNSNSFLINARAVDLNFDTPGGQNGPDVEYYSSVISDLPIPVNTIGGSNPVVSVTFPANNAEIPVNVPTFIRANASVSGSNIKEVRFYADGFQVGEPDTSAPYEVSFTPVSPGPYKLYAIAETISGVIGVSMPAVVVNAVQGNAPTSFLTTSTSATATATVSGGQINTPLTITRAGSGYTTAPEVRFVGGGGSNAVASATITNGAVTNIAVSPRGSGYTNAPIVVIDPPPVAVGSNSTVLLQAAAADNDGTIRQVEFLQNGLVVGTATNSPYNFNLPVAAAGRYELVARATDNLGNVTDSPVIVLNGTSGAAPTVSIVNPANTTPVTEVTPGIPVAVTVNASDTDGSVARVDLIVNGVVVGFSTQAPYIFTDAGQFSGGSNTTFTPTSEGTYVIVARATDNLGNVTDSASVTVRAKSAIPVGVAPTVQITQPIGEIYYVTGSSLFLNARATDAPPGEVDPDSVDFTVNGLAIPGAVIGQIGNDYGVRYTPTTPFTIDTIRAQATDDDGNTTYSQPNYTVLTLAQAPLPQVQMLDLLPSTPLDAGGVIKLRAEAFFPPTASQQSRVEFYANNVYVGTATQDATNPRLYTLDWESPETPAAYVIEARAVALNFQTNVGEGNVIEYFGSVISDNNIAVNTIPGTAPDVEITAPINGSTVAVGQPLTIRATAFVPSPSGPSVTEVTSPQAGTVTSVRVAVGQAIIVGTPLVDIQVAPGFSGTVSSTLVGTVKSIKVVPSSAVTVGSVLLEVIPVTTVTAPSAAAGGTVTSVVPVGTLVQAGSPLVGVTLPGGFTGTINSPITGVVTQVSVTVGNTLTNGQSVARIEPGGGSSGTIASVEFYANGVLLGVDNTAPYSIDFTPNSIGLYNLNAIAYSNAGLVSTSATISVSATLGSAPVVTITRPTQATATATLGTGSTAGRVTAITAGQLGSGYTTAPLVTLSAPPPGGVQATATAVLGTGASAGRITSYTITNAGVGYTAAPTVTVASPSGTLGSSLLVQASVSDSDGIITQVEFLVNGLVVQTLTAAPYSYNLPLASTGTYLLQVRATDNSGNVGVSAVEQFIVNQGSPPSVSITSPVNGATVSASQPLTVTANASDTDGSVVSVTFFQNGTQIGEPDTQAPYSATFTPGSSGQYTLVALAQDNSGNLTQSTPVVVTVPSTVVTTSVVSPTNGASFTLGTPVILTATASTTAGATISSVRFEVNSQPVGAPITSAPYTASFVPTALGSYTVRAIATDTSGGTGVSAQITFTVNNPVGSAPSIWLSQPSQGNYLTAGSSVFLNYTTFDTEGEIDPATLRIFVNGVALTNPAPQRIGPDGNTFGVRWNPGVTGTYVVSAQVSDFDGNTASSGTSTINVLPAQKTVPQVTIEPFVSASQYISVGLPIELRAKAKFFANTDPQVEFYANGVFVGTGVAGASNSDGSVSYSFVWTPDVAGTAITLTARAVGINFEQTEFVTPPGSTDTTIIRRNVYASSISSNRPTPPVTDLTINQVPADPAPGSNEAFVKFIFPTIFNRPATYAEYIYYVNQLQPFGNPATSSARATVIQELMGTVEYNSSYNVVYSFYYRLGLTPTRAAAATQIDVVKNNTAAETGFATHTTAQPQAPNLPTLGMSLAAQNLLGTLGNQTTVGLTPNVTKPLSQFSNIEFLNWLIPKLGGQAFNPSQMVSSMNTYSPQLRRQGSALAFLTQLYATYAAIDQNIADSRPTAVGPVNPNFRQDNLNYDAKLKGITINFLLTGVWSTSTAPLSNSMLASLLTSSAAAAKPVVTSGNASGDVAEYFTYQIEATNSPGGYTASNLPTWLRLNPETGLLTGRPGLGDDGIYLNVKVGAQNWAGEGTKFITIEIAPAPTAMSMAMLKAKYSYPSAGALGFGVDDSDAAQVRFRTVPGGLELVWTQLKNPAAYGVTYLIQQSAGLNNGWTPVTLAPGQVPQPVNDGVSVPDVDDYERVRVTLPISGSKGFYRVKATVPQ